MTLLADGVEVSSKDKGALWLNEKESMKLSAVIEPAQACQNVTWKSSSTKIATVDEEGNVNAVGKGSVTITATSCDGSKKTVKYTIVVGVPAKSVTVTASKTYIAKGTNITPKATVYPTNANNKTVRWEIDGNYSMVDFNSKTGKITVSKYWSGEPESVTLTAYANATTRDDVCGSVTINIVPALAKSVKIYDSTTEKAVTSKTMYLGDDPAEFYTVVTGTDLTDVTWVSSNPKVATVDNGTVTALSKGRATITVTTQDGAKTSKLTITVK